MVYAPGSETIYKTLKRDIRTFLRECDGMEGLAETLRNVYSRENRRFHGTPTVIETLSDYRRTSDAVLISATPFDMEAFVELVRRYDRNIKIAISRYKSGVDPNDLRSDFLLHLYTSICRGVFPIDASCGDYIYIMVKNFAVDKYRSSKSRRRINGIPFSAATFETAEDGTRELEFPGDGEEPWEIAQRREEVKILQEALGTLDDNDRLILKMRAEGTSHRQISEVLRIRSVAAVRQRYSRAVRRIRKYVATRLED